MKSQNLTWTEHLTELRSRLIKALLASAGGFAICWFFSPEILSFISRPIKPYLAEAGGRLIFIAPFEKFFSYLWASLFAGIILSSPVWAYQIWMFIAPGLYKKEKKFALVFAAAAAALFILGILFVYFIVYPFSFRFLINFGGDETPFISLKPYLSFFLRSSFAFGLMFEAPLVLFALLKLRLLNTAQLAKARPYALVLIALLSAIITPPDIFSMLFMMAPLYLLFEFSILIGAKLFKR